MSGERARQIANEEGFLAPVATGARRRWDREDIEDWMDEVRWFERYAWRRPPA